LGDGGNSDNAQRIDGGFYSGILRIDVDERPGNLAPNPHPSSVGSYSVPADNPFVGATVFNDKGVDPAGVRTELFAVGLRNPWRFSVDAATGAIIAGDVGEGGFEEVNFIVAGGNYGWPFREGMLEYFGGAPDDATLLDPIHAYGRDAGLSVIGGFIYRGSRLPELNGRYVFSDWETGEIRALTPDGLNPVPYYDVLATGFGFGPTAFTADPRNGDVLVCDNTGWATSIRRLVRNPDETVENLPTTLSSAGAFADLATMTPHAGILPYRINVPFLSDDAIKTRWFSLPDTELKFDFKESAPWGFPTSSVWIKHFEIDMEKGNPATRRRLETRFLVKTDDGVYGVTYRWTNESDAELVPEEGQVEDLERTIDGAGVMQRWTYPSRAACQSCHTPTGGRALGFGAAQLNCDQLYDAESLNQIAALRDMGYFTESPPVPRSLPRLAPADDATTSVERRARSYLHANCAYCHDGTGAARWDARIDTPLELAGIVDGLLNDASGDPANRVISPGHAVHSRLLSRISTRGAGQMPPLASSIVDEEGIALITEWIDALSGYRDFATWSAETLGYVALPDGDEDEDRLRNIDEYRLGLDPEDALERLEIDSIALVAGRPVIRFRHPANRAFRVEVSVDLRAWSYLDVPGNELAYPAVDTVAEISDIRAGDEPRFYRLGFRTR
jgi:mono/diheme cytochrome c family protein